MSEITEKKYSGGTGLATGELADDLRDIATDLAAIQAPTISAADVSATAAADAVVTAVADSVVTAVADSVVTAVADSVVTAVADSVVTAVADSVVTAVADAVVTAVADVSITAGVCDGLIAGAPTTPSSQAVDPGGFTDWNINISAGYVFANSVGAYFAAQVDFDVSSGAKIMEIGQAMYAWIVAAEAATVVTQEIVLGAANTLGLETIPTDGDITTGIGHANWTKIALVHASRTADAVVGTTEDPSYMTKWGGGASDLANDLKAKYNATVALANALKVIANANVGLANDIKAKYNDTVALVNALKVIANANVGLANDIKAKYNDTAALVNAVKVIANANVGLANDIKAKYNAAVTLMNEVKADLAEAKTLANEIKTDLNAIQATTLLTTAP